MGVAVVQTAGGVGNGTINNVANAVLPSNIAAGNYILVFSSNSSQVAGNSAITDSLGQTYTLIADIHDGANVGSIQAWYTKIAAGGACTVTNTTGTSSACIFAYELSSGDALSFLEGVVGTQHDSTTVLTSTSVPVGAPSSFNGLAVLGVAIWNNATTWVTPAPLAQRAQFGDGSFSVPMYIFDGAPNTTSPINLSADANQGVPFATIGILVKEANGVFQGSCGADADDRYRFRPSRFVSHTSTLGTHRGGWSDDAMDFGLTDTVNDNVSRMN